MAKEQSRPRQAGYTDEKRQYTPEVSRAATIFGAGVTGLTVAHELVERGFQVEVWEPTVDERVPSRGCAVGGMARTQWAAVPWPEVFEEGRDSVDWRATEAKRIEPIDVEFYQGEDGQLFSNVALSASDAEAGRQALFKQLREFSDAAGGKPPLAYVECLFPDHASVNRDFALSVVSKILGPNAHAVEPDGDPTRLQFSSKEGAFTYRCALLVRALVCPESEVFPEGTLLNVRFNKRERWLPGEHGYRFFPSFYSHVFETMKRTPILIPRQKVDLNLAQEEAEFAQAGRGTLAATKYRYTESGRTIFDNLIPARAHALAFEDEFAPLSFPRYRPGSLHAVLRQWRMAMEKLHYSPRDLARFALRVQEYAMMSPTRRKKLEAISWWQFIGGDEPDYYSRKFRYHMARWSEGLVAMNAEECDARSYGTILLQLMFDQYRSETDYRDGVLNGPTSDAWLDPWRRYLEAQGVRFIHGELVGFDRNGGLWPRVACYEPRYPGALDQKPRLMDGYFVVALPLKEAQKVTREIEPRSDGLEYRDLRRLAALPIEGLEQPRPEGELRHFAGVQFYFREDLSWVQGHIYYPDAPWGLSSICQPRFWQEKHDWEHGYRGILSVIVGTWDVRSPVTKKTAWLSTPDELAAEVWRQLRESLKGPNDPRLGETDSDEMAQIPDPVYWRLDANFIPVRDPATGKMRGYGNNSPLQINLPGRWDERPGDLPEPPRRPDSEEKEEGSCHGAPANASESRAESPDAGRYSVCGKVVLAGTYMKTYTRVTSMEAANEAGRHAVNAILNHVMTTEDEAGKRHEVEDRRFISKLCKLYPVEHREPADLGLVRDIDEKLAELESKLGGGSATSLVSALGLDRWTALLPKQRL